jgi:hypothetical protein
MPAEMKSNPVEDSVPKVGDEVAVGENLEFQRKWWKFERVVWSFFALLLLCDVLGLFGRGWLAKARAATPDGALTLDYEHIERASTPSIMTLHFAPSAIHDGHIQVYISESLIKPLGAQRISPQPALSTLSDGGITYTFAASGGSTTAEIALEPSFPGYHKFNIALLGGPEDNISGSVVVVP